MNVQSISNYSQQIQFGQLDTTKRSKSHLISNISAMTAAAVMALGVSGCGDDSFEKDHSKCGRYRSLHVPTPVLSAVSTLTKTEIRMLAVAKKLAGENYTVNYDRKNKALLLKAGDICKNKYNSFGANFKYDMAALKSRFALNNGVIVDNNLELEDVMCFPEFEYFPDSVAGKQSKEFYDEMNIEDDYPLNFIKFAHASGKSFFVPRNWEREGNLDDAILLPGHTLSIPIKQIGLRLRESQSEEIFDIFRKVENED